MPAWQVAFVKEQNVTFAVVAVKDHVLLNRTESERLCTALTLRLGCAVALLGERRHQTYGRADVVRFLQRIHPSQLPWRSVDLAA